MQKDRAKQFMPFNSLEGYFEMLEKENILYEAKKELTEEECNLLNDIIFQIRKKDMICITYYDKNHYEKKEGMISKISFEQKCLYVVKEKIPFIDIIKIEKL